MGIQVKEPWLLLMLPLLGLYSWWLLREQTRLAGVRRIIAVTLRLTVMGLLILAIAGVEWFTSVDRTTVVFLADRSDSMPDAGQAEDFIQKAAASKQPDDRTGVLSFGAAPAGERSVSVEPLDRFTLGAKLNTQWTDLSSALRLGAGLVPPREGGRLVLMTDGRENAGRALQEGKLLKNRGMPVDVLYMPERSVPDAAVDSLKVPEKLYRGEAYDVETTVMSTVQSDAVLRLYEDQTELAALQVRLEKGENRFAFPALAREAGLHRYRAEIFLSSDGMPANNAGYAFARVEGQSKVLIVEGESGSSKNLESAFASAFMAYETVPPEMLPQELPDYSRYESILLNNVPATRLSQGQMERLEQAVKEYGTGLVMLGGDQSYGLGGYFQTPVERALPVDMELKGKREIPSLALMLVIDKSGSMEGEKIRLAQEAAVRSVDLLRPKDTVGVLAFDGSPWWVVKPGKLEDKEKVKRDILSIRADGGTEIYPALKEAYDRLAETEAQRKHIILLTDGQSSGPESYEALAGRMAEQNITVSTVGIGDGADVGLLERIARLAKGRYYFASDISTVPAIFSREAVLMTRTYAVEKPFVPAAGQGADWAGLLAGGLPPLTGYVAATPKETAEVALWSPEPDPVLARWRYGAGKAVAWTSDVTGKWSKEWTAWSRFPDFVTGVVKWTFSEFQAQPYELSVRTEGGEAAVTVKTKAETVETAMKLEVTDERLNKTETVLTPEGPGEYSAKLSRNQAGVYMARITASNGASLGAATGFVIPYSQEYRLQVSSGGEELLRQLAAMTGGRLLSMEKPEDVFRLPPSGQKERTDLAQLLLAAALLLFLADIAVRRITLPWEKWTAAVIRLLRPLQPRTGESGQASAAGPTTFDRLGRRKEKLAPRFRKEEPAGSRDTPAAGSAPPGAATASSDSGDALPRSGSGTPSGGSAGRSAKPQLGSNGPATPRAAAAPEEGTGTDRPPEQAEEASGGDRMSRLLEAKRRKNR
ncbi:VWA domain-containing protein [Gorillibacterium sp. sgz5001074]|uniref:VWA domain-containing protein n=1 Tax=Gorillibacterium sp. sgz5001074 TaxID=3446695 RepID=UPI003F661E13